MPSGKASRSKGINGERESADLFRAAGFEVVRLQNNVLDAGDYTATLRQFSSAAVAIQKLNGKSVLSNPLLMDLLVESKRRERLNLSEASAQVEAAASQIGGKVPCVVYRRSREPWRVSLRMEDFLRIVAR